MNVLLNCAANKFAFLTPGYRKAQSLQLINGKPFVFHQVDALLKHGADKVTIALPKGNKEIPALFAAEPRVSFLYLEKSLGTGGALALMPKEDTLFVPGDIYCNLDIKRFAAFHEDKNPLITMFCHPEGHPESKDVLVLRPNGQGFIVLPKETTSARDFYYDNVIPTELCIVSKTFLETLDSEDPMDLNIREEILDPTLAVEMLFAYKSPEYVRRWADAPSIQEIAQDLQNGLPEIKNLEHPQKAIFVDRDGTITIYGDYVVKAETLQILPGVGQPIEAFHKAGYLVICITNQPVVARGKCEASELTSIHANLAMQLGKEGSYLDGLYFCPHFPTAAPGANMEFVKDCDCRKPKIGLVQQAQKDFGIDLTQSWFIGDTCRDVQTGINAGTKTCLVLGGDPNPYAKFGDAKPDITAGNIQDAAEKILAPHPLS